MIYLIAVVYVGENCAFVTILIALWPSFFSSSIRMGQKGYYYIIPQMRGC